MFKQWRNIIKYTLLLGCVVLGGWWPLAHAQTDAPVAITSEDSGRLGILTLLVQHTNTVTKIGFTPNGSAFYSAGFDGQYCVWNVDSGRNRLGERYFCVTDYQAGASVFAWSLDEKRLAITGDSGTSIRIFRATHPTPEADWNTPVLSIPNASGDVILEMQFVAGGLLAYDTNDTFILYNVSTGQIIRKFEGIEAQVSADGRRIALIDFDGNVVLIEGQTGVVLGTLPTNGVYLIAFSPDGSALATFNGDEVRLWAMTDTGYTRRQAIQAQPQHLEFSPDSRFLIAWENQSVYLWNINTGQLAGELPEHDGGISTAQFTPDMSRAVTIDSFGNGRIWQISPDGEAQRLLLMRDRVDRAYLGPDSASGIMGRIEFFARFYDIQRGQLRGQYTIPPDSEIAPDWSLIATITSNIITWHALPNDPRPLAFAPIATTREAINIRQTPSTEFARIAIIAANQPVFATARTADNQWLQVVLPDGTVGWTFVSTSLALQGTVSDLPLVPTD